MLTIGVILAIGSKEIMKIIGGIYTSTCGFFLSGDDDFVIIATNLFVGANLFINNVFTVGNKQISINFF